MQRLTTLQAFLVGAIPTALLCGALALALYPERGAPSADEPRDRAVVGVSEVEPVVPSPEAIAEALTEDLGVVPLPELEPAIVVDAGDAGPDAEDAGAPDAEDAPSGEPEQVEQDAAVEEAEEEEEEEVARVGPVCGPVTCPVDWVCCNASCGICTLPGQTCSQVVCGMPMSPMSVGCGPTTCDVGELCCDPMCGKCIRPGEPCTPARCLSPVVTPESEVCGMNTCNVGTVCCNPSCGICKPPGEPCTRKVCNY